MIFVPACCNRDVIVWLPSGAKYILVEMNNWWSGFELGSLYQYHVTLIFTCDEILLFFFFSCGSYTKINPEDNILSSSAKSTLCVQIQSTFPPPSDAWLLVYACRCSNWMKQEIVILKKESTGGNCALFPSSTGGRGSSADQQHIKALTTDARFFSSLSPRLEKLWPGCITISLRIHSSVTQTCNHSQSGFNHDPLECLSTPTCLSSLNSHFCSIWKLFCRTPNEKKKFNMIFRYVITI